jgi:hypothetical protein
MNAPVFSKKMPKQDFDLLDMMAPLVGVKAEKRITKKNAPLPQYYRWSPSFLPSSSL